MTMSYYLLYAALPGALLAAILLTTRTRRGPSKVMGLRDVSGPPPSSWLVGNLPSFVRAENVGDADSEFVEKYGLAFRIKGIFNRDTLYLADPEAIHYVLNTCGYTFDRRHTLFLFRMIAGPSLIATEGEDHARQRKILQPGFSLGILKEYVPLFRHVAQKVTGKWRDIVLEGGRSSTVVDVYSWISRLTLDSIGQGAFSYDFGAVNDTPNEFVEAYRNLFVDMFYKPSNSALVFSSAFRYLPLWLIPILRLHPGQGMKRLTTFRAAARKIGLSILEKEMQALKGGQPDGKDIMSSLVRANTSEIPKNRMGDEELISQMMSIMVAGHDTTSATLVWVFYELSRHPEIQVKLREEIYNTRAAAAISGRGELGIADFDSMSYTIAVIKETLRYYPIAAHAARTAGRDELIPLSNPVKTVSGDEIYAIPIKQNETVLISIWAYNRIKTIWGDDADEWNPERFLRYKLGERPKGNLGMYANLATFSSGVYSCIGWRFAVLQMQAVLITLIEHFKFSQPPSRPTILQASAPTLIPMVQGEEHRGAQMPLTITPIN